MILLNIFSVPLSLSSSPSTPIIFTFGLFIVSQISWMFCGKNLLDLQFSFVYFLYSIFRAWDSFFYLLYSVVYTCLCSSCSFTQIFYIHPSLDLCFLYYLHFCLKVLNCFHYLFDCFFRFSWVYLRDLLIFSNFLFVVSSISLREFFHFLLKGLPHFHKVMIKVDFCFFCLRMFKSSCCVLTGFWCYHLAFQDVGGILSLAPASLFLSRSPQHGSRVFCSAPRTLQTKRWALWIPSTQEQGLLPGSKDLFRSPQHGSRFSCQVLRTSQLTSLS